MDQHAAQQPARLRVLTFDPTPDEPACTGDGYTCPCAVHQSERDQVVARGVRPRKTQPWHPRELKRAA